MNPGTKTALAVVAGTAVAVAYVHHAAVDSSSDHPTYISPWTVDLAAWGAGATLIWLGYRHKSWLTSFLGAAIAAIHVAEFVRSKAVTKPSIADIVAGRVPVSELSDLEAAAALETIG